MSNLINIAKTVCSTQRLLALLLLTVFSQSLSAQESLEKVTIQLSWKYQFEFAPIIAAQEKGFYRDAGFEVEILEGGLGVDMVQRVVDGQAQYGIFTSALVLEYGQGQPVVAIAAMMQHSAVAVITDKPEIQSVHDLAGRTIAASPDTWDEVVAYLRAVGIRDDLIHVVEKTKWGLNNLEDYDAISAYTSSEGFYTYSSPKRYMMFNPRAAGIDMFGNILFTSRTHLEQHPQQVKAFREATLKGLDYALENPEALVDMIFQRYNTQHKTREWLSFEAEKIRELTRSDIVEPGYMSPGRWKHVAEVYASLGKLSRDIDLNNFIYDPHPKPNLAWFYALLALLLLVITAVSAALWHTRQLTKRLQQEMAEREQAQAALQESEGRFKDLFEKNPDPCWLIEEKHFIECNQEAVRILKCPDKTLLMSLHPADLSPELQPDGRLSREKIEQMMNVALKQGVHRFEWLHQRFDGETFPVEVTLAKYVQKSRVLLFCVWRDVTERKRNEKLKNEFVATVSHELRTPLTSLIGSIGLIKGGVVGEISEKSKQLLDISLNNANRLLLLINDLLDLSKIEAGKLEYNMLPQDLNLLVQQSIINNEHYGQKYQVTFRFNPQIIEAWVVADPDRFLQVMSNLLSNAAKFSIPGDNVEITTYAEAGRIVLSVADHGKGIPEQAKEQIFEKFSQADSSDTRSISGTGLGLSIAKSIIEAHDGDIRFESTLGHGTTFYVTLPVYKKFY